MLAMLGSILFAHKWLTLGTVLILVGLIIPLLMTASMLPSSFALFFLTMALIASGVMIRMLGCCFCLGDISMEG